jgi:hypothetical protein
MSVSAQDQSATLPGIECKEPALSNGAADLICLLPNGDATLVVPHISEKTEKHFSVSTSILSLASRYFDRLFKGRMAEAHELANKGSVSVNLDEDDPQAMEVILRVLHHQTQQLSINLDLSLIAKIAMHSDKYDTYTVLEPWVTKWLDALQPIEKSPIDIGLFLLATRMVHARPQYTQASQVALKELAREFELSWSTHELLQYMPNTTIRKITQCNAVTDFDTDLHRPTL